MIALKTPLTRLMAAALLAGTAGLALAAPAMAGADGAVKIGILNDRSGPYSDATGEGAVVAARMAVEDFGGKALGKPVEVVSADHQNKADIGSSTVNRWLDVEGVDAIFDVPNSGVLLALQEIVRNKDGILVSSGGGVSKFTGEACSPYGFQWSYDTYSVANALGRATVAEGGDNWFLVQVDYAFGEALAGDLTKAITEAGGKIAGSVKHPLNTPDFSSYLLQAQGSGANTVALINAGGDTVNALKQAKEFGLADSGQKMVAMLFFNTDVLAIGADDLKGLTAINGYEASLNAETQAFGERFAKLHGTWPTSLQIGVYSAVNHYLKAVEAAGTDARDQVAAKMREMPVEDLFVKDGKVRADGLMIHDMLLTEVKPSSESKTRGDVFKVVRAIPGDEAFRPLDKGGCPLVK
jgi:branched-chain amino acid transport system substrate-binding protein